MLSKIMLNGVVSVVSVIMSGISMLKLSAPYITHIITEICNLSITKNNFLMIGKRQFLHHFSRKVPPIIPEITGQYLFYLFFLNYWRDMSLTVSMNFLFVMTC